MAFIKSVASDAEFNAAINGVEPTKLIVIQFTAVWCGPCKAIKPVVAELAKQFRHVQFLSVDIDQLKETAQRYQISSVPTFLMVKGGATVAEVKGANPRGLQAAIQEHQGPAEDSPAGVNLGGHIDLTSYITQNQVECLNQSDDHTVKSIFAKDAQYLESDCDEQLIIVIPFNQNVKLHSIQVIAPLDKAPKSIRTYINRPSTLSFDEADSIEEIERIELSESTYKENAIIPLRFVKYQSVHSITLFIPDNLTGADTTAVQQIVLYGSPVEVTKPLSELKKHDHD
ncbi:Thioredoxin-like protein 1 [Blyttiomyces sp. JEL0837]|nr:Thioredoxin-like protein 1 [Blyttiomyces sp. JEL0837]